MLCRAEQSSAVLSRAVQCSAVPMRACRLAGFAPQSLLGGFALVNLYMTYLFAGSSLPAGSSPSGFLHYYSPLASSSQARLPSPTESPCGPYQAPMSGLRAIAWPAPHTGRARPCAAMPELRSHAWAALRLLGHRAEGSRLRAAHQLTGGARV